VGVQLGQPGQFGVAYLATRKKDGQVFAAKVIAKDRFVSQKKHYAKFKQTFASEVEILCKLNHPNIIKLHDVFEDAHSLSLVTDLCGGGELFERIQSKGSYSEKDASRVLRQITEAIKYLHDNRIAHCDLKPDNFLFLSKAEDSPIKVIDFGMSKFVERRKYYRQLCGTPYYIAPEVIQGKYNEACDMWSIGVVMFVMLFGFPPFWSDPSKYGTLSDEMIYRAIQKGFKPVTKAGYGPFFPQDIPCSESAKDLISKLLKTDVAERYTAEEALSHPWLRGETASSSPVPSLVVTAFSQFNSKNRFKNLIVHAMTSFLSDDQVEAVRTAFKTIDKDGNGSISPEEIKSVFKNYSDTQISKIMECVDLDGSGTISYEELLAVTVQRKILAKEERLLRVFRSLDKNGDGLISAAELKEIVKGGEDVVKVIAEVDKNGDGVVDYEEFIAAWGDYVAPLPISKGLS